MQPSFHCVANLGDATPFIHGGAFVLVDKRGAYAPELLILEPYGEDDMSDPTGWRLHTIACDRLTGIKSDTGERVALSDNRFHPDLPAWWAHQADLPILASHFGCRPDDLVDRALSGDPVQVASLYLDAANYHGAFQFDQEPRELSAKQAKKFCRGMLAQIKASEAWKDGWGFTLS